MPAETKPQEIGEFRTDTKLQDHMQHQEDKAEFNVHFLLVKSSTAQLKFNSASFLLDFFIQ